MKKNILVVVMISLIGMGLVIVSFYFQNQEREIESDANNIVSEIEDMDTQKSKEKRAINRVAGDSIEKIDRVQYPIHRNITTTLFWVGEKADEDNHDISNNPSAWDEKWVKHFGGVDDPKKRNGYYPSQFMPKENHFYFALPYNDFNGDGEIKGDVKSIIPWAKSSVIVSGESVCKNRWIKIMHDDKVVYAQWEDVGPFNEDDQAYVFGIEKPKSKINDYAGLDVSPAVNDYLHLDDIDTVDWQFVEVENVPQGPWKEIITTSGIYWE